MIRSFALLVLALVACAPAENTPSGNASPASAAERAFAVERTSAPDLLATGETRLVSVTVVNRGTLAWQPDGVTAVTYHWEGPDANAASADTTAILDVVEASERIDVVVPVVAPAAPGTYTLVWDVVDRQGVLEAVAERRRSEIAVRLPDARAAWDRVSAPEPLYADVASTFEVTLANAGTVPWPAKGKGAVLVSYHWRDLAGATLKWDGARTPLSDTMVPGERSVIPVQVVGPRAAGRYILELDLVREGIGWFGTGTRLTVDVAAASYRSAFSVSSAPAAVTVGQPIDVTLALANTGNAPWPNASDHRTRLAYHLRRADGTMLVWDGARTEIDGLVAGGERRDVKATTRAPEQPGRYVLTFELVQEGISWFAPRGGGTVDVPVDVRALAFKAHFYGVEGPKTMAQGLTYTVRATVLNMDAVSWPRTGFAPVRLGAHWLDANGKVLSWDAARADLLADAKASETVVLPLQVQAPGATGDYALVLDMVQDGVSWFAPHGTIPGVLKVAVAAPTFKASWSGALPDRARAGEIVHVPLTVRNDGPFAWPVGTDEPVRIAHHWRTPDGAIVVWDGFRTPLPHEVAPGESAAVDTWLFIPASPGRYVLEVDVVQEGITWFATRGSPLLRQVVEVEP